MVASIRVSPHFTAEEYFLIGWTMSSLFIHLLLGIRVFTPLGCCESPFCGHMCIPSGMDICFWFFGVCT